MNKAELAKELRRIKHEDFFVALPLDRWVGLSNLLLSAAAALEEEDRDARRWQVAARCQTDPGAKSFIVVESPKGDIIVFHSREAPAKAPTFWRPTIGEAIDAWLEQQEKEEDRV